MSDQSSVYPKMISKRPRIVRFLLPAALLALLPFSVFTILYWQVDRRSQIDLVRQADAIIILGCQVWPGERPSPALAARTQHAVDLYQAGYASHLILTGGVGTYPPAESEMMRRLAVAAGIPEQALVLDGSSHSTEENLANAAGIMREHGWKRALIVSDPFHLYRSEAMAHDLGMDAYGSPASASPTFTIPHFRVWYTARESLALLWYYAERVVGRPASLYAILKGRV